MTLLCARSGHESTPQGETVLHPQGRPSHVPDISMCVVFSLEVKLHECQRAGCKNEFHLDLKPNNDLQSTF